MTITLARMVLDQGLAFSTDLGSRLSALVPACEGATVVSAWAAPEPAA